MRYETRSSLIEVKLHAITHRKRERESWSVKQSHLDKAVHMGTNSRINVKSEIVNILDTQHNT